MASFQNAAVLILFTSMVVSGSNFFQDFDVNWGEGRGKIFNNGELLALSLDNYSGSGFQSNKEYWFGKFDMQLKLVPGNSAGIVTALYLSSGGSNHDEIDFEFLGNLSGEPYTVHTNVYTQGKGERESSNFSYGLIQQMIFIHTLFFGTLKLLLDNTPLREFKNLEKIGVPFPKWQPMMVYSTIWNADEWATRGGLIKTDWTQAPFVSSYRNFSADACVVFNGGAAENCTSEEATNNPWMSRNLDRNSEEKLKWVLENYMIYNYCSDGKRFLRGFPPECYA